MSVLFSPSVKISIFVIAFFTWANVGRIVRGQVLSIREKEYVEAARSLGAGDVRIMVVDVLPNLVAPIIVYATLLIPTAIVFEANQRCNQENLNAQLKGGLRALTAPVDNLESNWAYMVMAALAWNLKSWYGLLVPNRERGLEVVKMEFRRFLNAIMLIPCQIVRTARRLVYRLLAWNPWQGVFFRLLDQLALPLRH